MQRDAGSSREPCCRSTMSQHVPMSPRARTAADIIIVYSRRPWESGRHCAFPLWLVAECSWVKVVCSVSPVRGTRVLDGVSSPRPDSDDCCDAVCERCWVRRPLPNQSTRFHYGQPGLQQRGLRRTTRERGDCTRALVATTYTVHKSIQHDTRSSINPTNPLDHVPPPHSIYTMDLVGVYQLLLVYIKSS